MRTVKSVIGIGEYAVSDSRVNSLKTYALASCVAVTAYSPAKRVGAMIHVALPKPGCKEDGFFRPGYYATTGIPIMIDRLIRECGCTKEELQIRIYGGAESMSEKDIFHIGRRNVEAVLETLANMHLKIVNAEVGGRISRTIELDATTGMVEMHTLPITI